MCGGGGGGGGREQGSGGCMKEYFSELLGQPSGQKAAEYPAME